jgi:hypothetical protein
MVTKVLLIALLISAVAAQQLGFTIYGSSTEYFGESTAINGDVNGDGISDLVVGAPYTSIAGSDAGDDGVVYVLYGKTTSTSPFPLTTNTNSLTSTTGVVINGVYESELGSAVAIGDVNGDGIDDIIMGAPDWYNTTQGTDSEPGAVFVVFGSKTLPAVVNVTGLDGTNGFGISGVASGDVFGTSVATGDVNGDGIVDIIIGAISAAGAQSTSGCAYVFFGHTGTFPSFYYAGALGSNGITLNGAVTYDQTGFSVAAGGDFNGDSIGDFLIGAPYSANGNNAEVGVTYAVFGSKTLGNPITLSALTGSNGFSFTGINGGDELGTSVSIGDFNGDGIDDIQSGATGANSEEGAVYVIWGSKTFGATVDLSTLNGDTGFVIYDTDHTFAYPEFGYALSCSSDLNNDAIVDLVIGSYEQENDDGLEDDAGSAFVIFGTKTAFGPNFNTTLLDGTNGGVFFGINEGDETGWSVASGGDLNNDGIGDFVVGAQSASAAGSGNNFGAVYILFGQGVSAPIGSGGVFNLTTLLAGVSLSVSPVTTTGHASPSNSPHTTGSTTAGTTTGSGTTTANGGSSSPSPSPSPSKSAANAGPVMSVAALFFW